MEHEQTGSMETIHHATPDKWVENYADYLFAYAITRLNDEEQARDLIQETFLAGLEKLKKFEGRSTERTWLTAILKNKIVDVYRRKSSLAGKNTETIEAVARQSVFFNESDGHWTAENLPQEFERAVDDPLIAKEFTLVMEQCMKKLPSLWLAVFTMKHMDELASDTICKDLKLTAGNFWVIIHRTKLNLRDCLQKNWI